MGKLDRTLRLRLARYIWGAIIYAAALFAGFSDDVAVWLFMAAYFIFGVDVIFHALRSISKGQFFNEHFLMSIATIGAHYIGLHYEAVLVMIFFQIGEFFQDMAVNRSRQSIKDLMDIKAEYANLIIGTAVKRVDPAEVAVGSIILVKPGEKVPLDGIVIEGESQVDLKSLIGESVPRTIVRDDEILSGAINLTTVLKVRVTKDFENSTVARIMEMTENAAANKSKTETIIRRFSRVYTPIVTVAALLLMFVPMLIFPHTDPHEWVLRGIVFLMISCPCALHLSVPLSFFSGIGASSSRGILVKGATYIQTLVNADIVAFDKTGTITKGVFEVVEVAPAQGIHARELLDLTASVEAFSNHPIARSIVEAAGDDRNVSVLSVDEIAGKGLVADVGGEAVLVGNARLLQAHGVSFVPCRDCAGSVVYISRGGKFLGHIIISDIVKEETRDALETLREIGVKKTVMLSGDRAFTAQRVADDVGICEVYAELLPDQKVQVLEQLYEQNPGATILFVGDGINDAPVLTRADVGIAMGGVGSDAAVEAADMVIMTDEISKIATAIKIARRTVSTVRQNIIFVMTVKIAVLVLALFGVTNIIWAVIADSGVTLIAAANAVRKKRYD